MPDPKQPRPRKLKKRRTTVSIGGTSQSAFAGYAPDTTPKLHKPKPSTDPAPDLSTEEKAKDDGDPAA